jgi:predicted RNA-binding protein with EMAP domain
MVHHIPDIIKLLVQIGSVVGKHRKEMRAHSEHERETQETTGRFKRLEKSDIEQAEQLGQLTKQTQDLATALQEGIEHSKRETDAAAKRLEHLENLTRAMEAQIGESKTRDARLRRLIFVTLAVAFAAFAAAIVAVLG